MQTHPTAANMAGDPKFFLSEMKQVWTPPSKDAEPRLLMDQITDFQTFHTWPAMSAHLATNLRYPRAQHSKLDAYGWTPTLFSASTKAIECKNGRIWNRPGTYRLGEYEIDAAAICYFDVDNARTDIPFCTMTAVSARLGDEGIGYLLYSTFSNTAQRPKFRVVIPLDQIADRRTLRLAYLYAQRYILAGQGDASIYDPADFVFAPCFTGRILQRDGDPLGVDEIEQCEVDPTNIAWIDAIKPPVMPDAHTPERAASFAGRMASWTVGSGVSITNPAICNPEWIADYGGVGRSHNADIGSILAKVWKMSGGGLGVGEMAVLYDEVDALDGNYCGRKYGQANKMDRIKRVMRSIHTAPNTAQDRQASLSLLAERMTAQKARHTS